MKTNLNFEEDKAKSKAQQAKSDALQKEIRFKQTMSLAKIGGWELDVLSSTFLFNDSFYEIFKSSVDRIGGYKMSANEYAGRFIHPDDREVVVHEIEKAILTKDPEFSSYLEHRFLYDDGGVGYMAVKYFITKNESGETIKLYGVNEDISYRKEFENKLTSVKQLSETNEARYQSLLTNLETGVVVHAADTSIITCNERSEELLGLSEEQMRGKVAIDPYWKFIYEDGTPLPLDDYPVMRVKNSKHAQRNQIVGVQRSKDEIIWVLVNGFPELDKNGEIKEITISFIDITERKIAEEALKIAKERAEESDRLKTAFLQNISHEIRTPLNAICGFAQLLSKKNLTQEQQRSHIALIKSSSDQLLGIISDVLALSSLETGQVDIHLGEVNVNVILLDLLAIFNVRADAKKISLNVHKALNDQQAVIESDETKLRQVLSNLLTNAFKFTSSGSIDFGYKVKEASLEFYVKDTGIGIKNEYHQKIFERFSQADNSIQNAYGGTGLGLSISKGYVELLGGTMWVESEVSKGSIFYFSLPFNYVNSGIEAMSKAKFKILVAEDQLLNFLVIEGLLEDLPVDLIHAKTGEEAIELFQENPNIPLVLMDIKMPGITGDEAAEAIRSINPHVKIIAQSGFAMQQDKEKYKNIFDEYITKPIDIDVLLNMVKKYMD